MFVTSRLFGYRLDILRLAASRAFDLRPFFLRASLGLALQGHFAGQEIQNAWHRYVVLYPELSLPYQGQDAALYSGGGFDYRLIDGAPRGLRASAFADLDLYTGVGPSAIRIGADAAWKNRFFDLQAIAGLEGHFLLPTLLEPLLSDGIASAVLFSWKPTRYFNMSLGIGVFPVGLVTDDPRFLPKSYTVTSQFLFFSPWERTFRV